MNAYFKGAACGVVASVSYGLNPLFALPLYSAGIGPDSVLFYRYVLAILMLGALTMARGRRLAISRAEVLPLMVLGVLFSLSSLTLYLSFLYMDAGIACTILFVYPLLVSLIMTLFFHEKATLFTYGCIAMALCGIALLYRGEGGVTFNGAGFALVMVSSLSYALYMVAVRQWRRVSGIEVDRLTFWALAFGSMIYVARLDMLRPLQPLVTPLQWADAALMALLPTVVSLFCIGVAIHHIGSTFTAIIGALEPVTALAVGVCVFGERISARIVLGMLLVLTSVTLIVVGRPMLSRLMRSVASVWPGRRSGRG